MCGKIHGTAIFGGNFNRGTAWELTPKAWNLEIFRRESGVLGDPGQHFRAKLFATADWKQPIHSAQALLVPGSTLIVAYAALFYLEQYFYVAH